MSDDGGIYSEGAARVEGKSCHVCIASAWVEADAVKYCGVARSIDLQRVAPSPVLPADSEGPLAAVAPGFKVAFALTREEFTALQAMIDASAQNRERLKDGQWSLAVIYDGYALLLPRIEQWDRQIVLIHKWRKLSPKSAAAALMEARYWIAYASIARGPGRFESVPASARRILKDRAAMARSVLEQSKSYAATNPLWFYEMLKVATLEGWPYKKKASLFDAAVKVAPDFDPIYVAMATTFAPRWGGSLTQYQRFVDEAVVRTRASHGESMYATLYGNLAWVEHDQEPFGQLDIPWEKMKAGFTSLLGRYPESDWYLQNFAAFGCRAGDAKTFLSLLPALSTSTKSKMGNPPWSGAYTFDYCRGLYTKPA